MTTITLEVPDELAKQLDPIRPNLPSLLARAIQLETSDPAGASSLLGREHPLIDETVNLLAGTHTPADILAFKYSPKAQARLQELLDKNREESLDSSERGELELYSQLNHLMILVKARARQIDSNPN